MLTRTELQTQANLSRKALRVYEEKGLLDPSILRNGRAVFEDNALERAIFIATLREVGVSINTIGRLLDPTTCADGFLLNTLIQDLSDLAAKATAAIDLIEKYKETILTDVFEQRYGGFWTLGLEATIKKRKVVSFVESAIEQFEINGFDTSRIAARYTSETNDHVTLRVFQPVEGGVAMDTCGFERTYLPEHKYFALRAIGFYGNYHCFDDAYAKIEAARHEQQKEPPPLGEIEVYQSYPTRASPGKAFETLILA